MREVVFFTRMENYFSNTLYSEMVKTESVTPVVINKNKNLSKYIKNSKGRAKSLIYIINDEVDLYSLSHFKKYFSKTILIFLKSNKNLLKDALSLNPSLILISNNNIKNNFPIMEKVLKM